MVRMRPRPVWHLRRGQKLYGRVSDQELRLLVELGHLKSNDLLWRSGFGGWKSAESVPGVLNPGQLPPVHSISAQLSAKITALFAAVWRWVIPSQATLARKLVSQWSKFHVDDFSELMRQRGALAGLLIAAMFVGSAEVAMRAFAIGAETSQKAASPRTDNVRIVAAAPDTAQAVLTSFTPQDAAKTVQSPSQSKPEIDSSDGSGVLSVSNIHPTDGFVSKPSPGSPWPSEASAEPESVTNTTHVPQSDPDAGPDQPDAAAQPDQFDTMPMPTRKPAEGSIAKEEPRGKAALKRIAHRREREPKPLRFGNIGFNYYAQ